MMFLCLSITFISSISEMRSAKSLSVASSEAENESRLEFCALSAEPRAQHSLSTASFTFEHLHSNCGGLIGAVLVNAVGLGSDHLTKAALSERFTQC